MKISLNCCFFNVQNVEKEETREDIIKKAKAIKEKRKHAELDDEVFSQVSEKKITLYEMFMTEQTIDKVVIEKNDEKLSWPEFVKNGK